VHLAIFHHIVTSHSGKRKIRSRLLLFDLCITHITTSLQSSFKNIQQIQVLVSVPQEKGWQPSHGRDGCHYSSAQRIGAIAVWQTGGGGHGHVAYVYAVNNGIASLDEYNSGFPLDSNGHLQWGLFYSGRTTASGSAGTPYRYIHIGTVPSNKVNTPASISFKGALNVFKIGGDGQVYTEYNSGNGWSGWASLGGHQMVGSPKVIMYGSSQMDVFALDTNKVPYVDKWTSTSGWSGWTSMGNYMASGASPASIMYGSSEMDLFYRGGDNNIYKNTTFDGTNWGGFGSLGSPSGTTITGNPSVLSYTAEGEYDIYVNTTSGHIYKRMWDGSWSGWTDMGGGFVGNPYAMQYGSDMNLFARGTNNQIYQRYWSYGGQFWSGWSSLGGNLASDPFALQYGSSELDVFATGTDGKTDHDTFTPTNGWGGFSAL